MIDFVHQSCVNLQTLNRFKVQLLIVKVVFAKIITSRVIASEAVEDELLTLLLPPLQELLLDCLTLGNAGDPGLTWVQHGSTWFNDVQ